MTPNLGPDGMWHRPDMRLALARHDLRHVFHLMRRYGIPQRRIAAATGMNQSEISEILTGPRIVRSYAVFLRLAEGFGLPRGWLGLNYDPDTLALLAVAEEVVVGPSGTGPSLPPH